MELRNKKIDEAEFMKSRCEVLTGWPTGAKVDIAEAVEFHKNLPRGKIFSNKLNEAKNKADYLPQNKEERAIDFALAALAIEIAGQRHAGTI